MMCKGLNDETSCLDILDSNHQGSIPRPVTTEYGIPTVYLRQGRLRKSGNRLPIEHTDYFFIFFDTK